MGVWIIRYFELLDKPTSNNCYGDNNNLVSNILMFLSDHCEIYLTITLKAWFEAIAPATPVNNLGLAI